MDPWSLCCLVIRAPPAPPENRADLTLLPKLFRTRFSNVQGCDLRTRLLPFRVLGECLKKLMFDLQRYAKSNSNPSQGYVKKQLVKTIPACHPKLGKMPIQMPRSNWGKQPLSASRWARWSQDASQPVLAGFVSHLSSMKQFCSSCLDFLTSDKQRRTRGWWWW